jgi:hypothetical protein
MASRYSFDQLVARLKSPGWRLKTDKKDKAVSGTLEDLVKVTKDRHEKGEHPGLIEEIETTIELDMIQLAELWRHLGLPV